MSDVHADRRHFSRAELDVQVDVHQGGSVWHQRLIDISLSGIATDQPDTWDAQYNEAFTLIIHLKDSENLELHAYLQHVEDGRLGFAVEHVDEANIEPLRLLMEARMGNSELLQEELNRLDS